MSPLALPPSRLAAGAASSSRSHTPARSPLAVPASRRPSTRLSAQVGEPSKNRQQAPPGAPGAPAPKKGGEDGDAPKSGADAAAVDYAEGVARVAEEGMSAAGDVEYAARADAIAAERKAAETGGEDLSPDDIRRLAALRRSQQTAPGTSPANATGSLLQGVLEEARLIEWPTLGRAAGDTAVVLAIVATSAALLFAINYALTEVASLIY